MLVETRSAPIRSLPVKTQPRDESKRTIAIVTGGVLILFAIASAAQNSWLGSIPDSLFHKIRLASASAQ